MKSKLSIRNLLLAGLTPLVTAGISSEAGKANSDAANERTTKLEPIVAGISDSKAFTLAAHSSHGSHISHGSHTSHGSGYYEPGGLQDDTLSYNSRNESSTPRSTILPSSPAIARKPKILRGNSKKFVEVVRTVQTGLFTRGYDVGPLDGRLHARTIAAIYRFQKDSGAIPDGKLSDTTLASLGIVVQ